MDYHPSSIGSAASFLAVVLRPVELHSACTIFGNVPIPQRARQ